LPKANNLPTVTKPEDVTIAVDKSGEIYWNARLLENQDALKAELRSIAPMNPQPEVHIRGDMDARYMYVGQVLVAAQQIGIRKVAFLTSPLHPGEAP
jgi:biopolymer transport protein ExbD